MPKNIDYTEQPWERDGTVNFLRMGRPYVSSAYTEVDVTDLLDRINLYQRKLRMGISLHGIIIHYLAQAAKLHPLTLTYRYRDRLITFEDADITTTILRTLPDGRRFLT